MPTLGPRAKRVDIIAYKGIKWSTLFSISINNVPVVLSTGAIITGIRRSMDGPLLAQFTQVPVDTTHTLLVLPAVNSLVSGIFDDAQLSQYWYSIVWRSGTMELMVVKGALTLGPVAANV